MAIARPSTGCSRTPIRRAGKSGSTKWRTRSGKTVRSFASVFSMTRPRDSASGPVGLLRRRQGRRLRCEQLLRYRTSQYHERENPKHRPIWHRKTTKGRDKKDEELVAITAEPITRQQQRDRGRQAE